MAFGILRVSIMLFTIERYFGCMFRPFTFLHLANEIELWPSAIFDTISLFDILHEPYFSC